MTVRVRLIRPDDLVNLLVEAGNMRLDSTDPAAPVLVVEDPDAEAYLAIGFPPQTVVEEAVFDQPPSPVVGPAPLAFVRPEPTAPSKPAPDGVLASRLSGGSRLVFTVPPDARIPYTFEGLLDWADLEPRLSPLAAVPLRPTAEQARQAGAIVAPESGHTALELPYRLVLSPTSGGRWIHRSAPVTHAGRTELWHTRLGHAGRTAEGQGEGAGRRRGRGRRRPHRQHRRAGLSAPPGASAGDLVTGLPEPAGHGRPRPRLAGAHCDDPARPSRDRGAHLRLHRIPQGLQPLPHSRQLRLRAAARRGRTADAHGPRRLPHLARQLEPSEALGAPPRPGAGRHLLRSRPLAQRLGVGPRRRTGPRPLCAHRLRRRRRAVRSPRLAHQGHGTQDPQPAERRLPGGVPRSADVRRHPPATQGLRRRPRC